MDIALKAYSSFGILVYLWRKDNDFVIRKGVS